MLWLLPYIWIASVELDRGYDRAALLAYARSAITAEVRHLRPPVATTRHSVKPVFVTIEVSGNVHGCRGSLDTRTDSLENEIILSAQNAAAHDPKHAPITAKQLESMRVTVTVIESKRPIEAVSGLAPADGLAVQSGTTWGVVLPFEGKEPGVRLRWAYAKAGLPEGTPVNMYRLVADRF